MDARYWGVKIVKRTLPSHFRMCDRDARSPQRHSRRSKPTGRGRAVPKAVDCSSHTLLSPPPPSLRSVGDGWKAYISICPLSLTRSRAGRATLRWPRCWSRPVLLRPGVKYEHNSAGKERRARGHTSHVTLTVWTHIITTLANQIIIFSTFENLKLKRCNNYFTDVHFRDPNCCNLISIVLIVILDISQISNQKNPSSFIW